MKKTLLILFVVLIMISVAPMAVNGSDFEVQNGVLTKYNGTAQNVTIPGDVYSIGEGAFQGNTTIETVAFPNQITSIGIRAFYGCTNLKSSTTYDPDPVVMFVNRCYKIILGRDADETGLTNSVSKLKSQEMSGAQLVEKLLFSQECQNKHYDDDTVVEKLFNAMLDRPSDPTGKANKLWLLQNGVSYRYLINGFSGSSEFSGLCNQYGINPGSVTLTENRDKNLQVTQFVNRLYTILLDRSAEVSGLNNNTGLLLNKQMNAAQIVDKFVKSAEFTAKHHSNDTVVEKLYRTMLNRASDSTGKANKIFLLESGVSYSYLVNSFSGSQEFKNLCNQYGIDPGSLTMTENRDKNLQVTQFVNRLYTKLLDRSAEVSGLNSNTGLLLNKQMNAAQLVEKFVKSAEFTGKHHSNDTVVEKLYQTMLNRASDAGGKANKIALLESGVSYSYLVNSFSESQEFKNLCNQYGINPGSLTMTENRDKNLKVTQFVSRLYEKALNRKGEVEGINNWCGRILNKEKTPQEAAYGFVFSQECKNRNLNNQQFLTMLYRLYMNREPDQGGLNNWMQRMNQGMTRETVVNSFGNSSEFKNIVNSYGL